MSKFIDFSKEPMLFPELEEEVKMEYQGKVAEHYKTITEVASELELATSVIRYWETKFPIDPIKRNGRRYYCIESQKNIKEIKDLLYLQGYTIKAVQDILKTGKKTTKQPSSDKSLIQQTIVKLEKIREAL